VAFDTISVIGLGYIGLPTAAMFASKKKKVIGVDVNQHAIDTINQGKIHIVEPELDIIVHATVSEGFLKATANPKEADAFLIAVPTPFKGDHEPDLAYIKDACKAIAPVLKKGDLIILESTSPVGATEKIADWLSEIRHDLTFPQDAGEDAEINIAHCPERVLPGHIVRELVENDRVIGGMTPKCAERACELYKIFVEGECIVTNARTAEMAKLTENSFRDVNIALANELSIICEKLGIDVWELIELTNRHPRVNILQPGAGVGGHCIAVDPWFIVNKTPNEARLIHTARQVNDYKPSWVVARVNRAIEVTSQKKNKTYKELKIACYGLAFKPDIDDLRESPALKIVKSLSALYPKNLIISEPNIESLPEDLASHSKIEPNGKVNEADIHVFLVAHKQYKLLDFSSISQNSEVIDVVGLI
jgi:UDP-N-acetyl-D-mannosaminuronic acid dehydrogenase